MKDVTLKDGAAPTRVTLANGLQVVAVHQPHVSRALVALYVRVGSRFEDEAKNGLSHFLEHMIYRGTPSLKKAHDVNLAFESIGGYLYAATQVDYAVFSVAVPLESLERAVSLFADVLVNPTFSDIEIEKGIVCEEILEDLDDDGRQIDADNLSRKLVYPTHPLGFTITGSEKTVKSFTPAMLRAHHAKHFTTGSAALVFSGNVDTKTATALAEKHFTAFPRGDRVEAIAPPATQKKPRLSIVENSSSQTELRLSFRAIADAAPDKPAMDMLMRLVDDGMSSRLYHRICDSKGLCYDVTAGFDGYEDDGIVDFAAGVQHARADRVTSEILELMKELATDGPTDEELVIARRRHAWDIAAMKDSAEDMAGFYGHGVIFGRSPSLEKTATRLDDVTAEDVRRLTAKLCEPDRLNVVAVGLLEADVERRLKAAVTGWK
ncbi:MAG TPA: pitrilysin family protein [Polyangiaceae bacterium]